MLKYYVFRGWPLFETSKSLDRRKFACAAITFICGVKKIHCGRRLSFKIQLKIQYLLPYTGSRKVLENIPAAMVEAYAALNRIWTTTDVEFSFTFLTLDKFRFSCISRCLHVDVFHILNSQVENLCSCCSY